MSKWIFRLIVGLGFALPLMLVTVAFVQADNPAKPPKTDKCFLCHSDSFKAWDMGAHGLATSDKIFQETWQGQGQPEQCLACHTTGYDPTTGQYQAEGVTCAACHGPIPKDHPDEPIAIDRTAKSCGDCHINTLLEWQTSVHRANDLTCVNCHDAHTTQLKADSPSALCTTCHKERPSNTAHTSLDTADFSCADCHLAREESAGNEPHIVRNHSFNVQLSTCNQCHASEMHSSVGQAASNIEPTPTPTVTATITNNAPLTQSEPEPVGPTGFAALAVVLGFGGGIIVAPWIERWYRNINRH